MTEQETSTSKLRQSGRSILRQLVGAMVGGSLAVGIYVVYEYGSPLVTAWLSVPQSQYSASNGRLTVQQDLKEEETRRIAQRTQSVVNTFGQEVETPPPQKPLPSNWDIEAIGDAGTGRWDGTWTLEQGTSNPAGDAEKEVINSSSEGDPEQPLDQTQDDDVEQSEKVVTPPIVASIEGVLPAGTLRQDLLGEESEENVMQIQSSSALPESGPVLWVAILLTFCGTAALQRRRILAFVRGKGVW